MKMMPKINITSAKSIAKRIRAEFRYRLPLDPETRVSSYRLLEMANQVARQSPLTSDRAPVVFFNASTSINRMSLNSAFSLLTSWSLRLTGIPVVHFVCSRGMTRCVLGTDRDNHKKLPPCEVCMAHSRLLYTKAPVNEFNFNSDPELKDALHGLNLSQLTSFEWHSIPYGSLTLPSLRWILRRHHLTDDAPTCLLMQKYILSANHVAQEFNLLIDKFNPQVAVLFNGMFFPEAVASWVARQHNIPVVTHEVGYRPFSAFFTKGEATAYPLDIPEEFELDAQQNAHLDDYLENRFKGDFTMAGIRFWPEIRNLSEEILERASLYKQIVPVFSNVVFDTSQGHANTIFPNMFAWLDAVFEIIKDNPDTLFILRAHPDEVRPGKVSLESVEDWVDAREIQRLPNIIFVKSDEYISSYELVQRSKFVMVYNSSIGLEAAVMGKPVLTGGKARYTRYPIVFFPQSLHEFLQQADAMLQADQIEVPNVFIKNARRFLYYQFFRASLPFNEYIENAETAGFVKLSDFYWEKLLPENSQTMRVIHAGLFQDNPFFCQDEI